MVPQDGAGPCLLVPPEKLVGLGGHWPGSQDGFCAAGSLLLLCVMGLGLGAEPPGGWEDGGGASTLGWEGAWEAHTSAQEHRQATPWHCRAIDLTKTGQADLARDGP